MSGKSRSSSSSSNLTTNIDGRSVADAQGQSGYATQNVRDNGVLTNTPINVTGGGKGSATSAYVNVTNSVTDFGSVAAALNSNSNVVNSAFKFGNNVVKDGLTGYQDLLALTGDTFQAVFDIAKKNTETVDHITSTTTEAIQKARNAELKVNDTNRYLVAGGLAVLGIVAVKIWAK